MAIQDVFKNGISEANRVDAELAAIFGWTDIEQTDFGAVVGKSPEGHTENIPRPSKSVASFHSLLKKAVREHKLNIRFAWDDGFFVQADDGVYIVTDTDQSLLKAGSSAINAVLSMYMNVPADVPADVSDNDSKTREGDEAYDL